MMSMNKEKSAMEIQFLTYTDQAAAIFACGPNIPNDSIIQHLKQFGEILSVARITFPNGNPTGNILATFKDEISCRDQLGLNYFYSRRDPKQKDRIFFYLLPDDTFESLINEFGQFEVLDYVHLPGATGSRPVQTRKNIGFARFMRQ